MYIRYTRPMNPIRVTKSKVPRVKRAKWEEVPESYRKKRLSCPKLEHLMSEILLYVVGLIEFIRKEIL